MKKLFIAILGLTMAAVLPLSAADETTYTVEMTGVV
jgi:hypothetical protein